MAESEYVEIEIGFAVWLRSFLAANFEASAMQGAVDIVSSRTDIKKLNGCRLFGDIVLGCGRIFCEAEKCGEFGDPKNGTEAGRVGPGDKNMRILLGLGSAGGR